MIFVTVGTELPFDRMIRAIDHWAGRSSRTDVFAQIGNAIYEPEHIAYARFLDATAFRERFQSADLIISHAGMGSILTALSSGKPIMVMPREAARGEHRNDHQLATARRMLEKEHVEVAFDEAQLVERLERLDQFRPKQRISPYAAPELIDTLRAFIAAARPGARPATVSSPALPFRLPHAR